MKIIQWYPGHMAKTKRQIMERLKYVDVVFELLDARAPSSSQNPMIQEIVATKPRLILLNKADLADPRPLEKWLKHFAEAGHEVLKINALSGMNLDKIVPAAKRLAHEVLDKEKRRGRLPRPVRAMILGIPNVGKSTLINQLVSRRVTKVGDVAGITKHLQIIRIHDDLELLDTPGILWPKFDDQDAAIKLALLGAIKDNILAHDDIVIYGFKLLIKHYKTAFEQRYDITVDEEDMLAIFNDIGTARGCLRKGGEIDYDRVMDLFLHDFRHAAFGPIMLDRGLEDVRV